MSLELQHNSKLVWIIGAVIVLIACGLFAGQWYLKQQKAEQLAAKQAAEAAQLAQAKAQQVATAPAAVVDAPASEVTLTLVDDSMLTQPIPQNPSLAKEEIAKLADIETQLKEQKASLESQHSDADQLLKLKEEQLKLLEAQLAAS